VADVSCSQTGIPEILAVIHGKGATAVKTSPGERVESGEPPTSMVPATKMRMAETVASAKMRVTETMTTAEVAATEMAATMTAAEMAAAVTTASMPSTPVATAASAERRAGQQGYEHNHNYSDRRFHHGTPHCAPMPTLNRMTPMGTESSKACAAKEDEEYLIWIW
jgi:hypothetical protein